MRAVTACAAGNHCDGAKAIGIHSGEADITPRFDGRSRVPPSVQQRLCGIRAAAKSTLRRNRDPQRVDAVL